MPQDTMVVSALEEIVKGTWEMLSKAQFPTMIPLAACHLLLIHPNQPTNFEKKGKKLLLYYLSQEEFHYRYHFQFPIPPPPPPHTH